LRLDVQASSSNFDRLADDVWAMLNQFTAGDYFRSHGSPTWAPTLNLYEAADCFVVCAELSGMKREDIDVSVDRCVLTIRGARSKPPLPLQTEDVSVLLMEINSGPFMRTVNIPEDVCSDRISALYREGYLFIVLPRGPSEGPTEVDAE